MRHDRERREREKEDGEAMAARIKLHSTGSNQATGSPKSRGRNATREDKYFNCKKKGHFAKDCVAKGGGKEGQPLPSWNQRWGSNNGQNTDKGTAGSAGETAGEEFAFAAIIPGKAARAEGAEVTIRLLDTGASQHCEPERSNFIELHKTSQPHNIELADGK